MELLGGVGPTSLGRRRSQSLSVLSTYREVEPAQIALTLRHERLALRREILNCTDPDQRVALSGALCRCLELSMRASLMPTPPRARTEPDGRLARPVLDMPELEPELEPEPAPEPAPEPQS